MQRRWTALGVVMAIASGLWPAGSAEAASCGQFGNLRSQESRTKVTVTFVNRTNAYRSVDWLDFNGRPVNYANLNPGETYRVDTYLTHPWMITDGPGNCVQMVLPRRGQRVIDITGRSRGGGD